MSTEKTVLKLTVTRHKGGTFEVAAQRPLCVHCGHHHYGEPDEDGTVWCDTSICGDGCCHCACYTPVYRSGPSLLGAVPVPASEPVSEQFDAAWIALAVVVDALDDAIKAAVNGAWTQDDYEKWYAAREHGEAALAAARGSTE